MKLTLVIRALDFGGAERQLINLANGLAADHEVTVLTYYPGGQLAAGLAPSVRRIDAGKAGRWDLPGFLWRFLRALREAAPDTVYAFMDTPGILLTLLRPLLPEFRLVWGIRASDMQMSNYNWLSRAAARGEVCLARHADAIICNSRAGFEAAVARGIPAARMCVIHNGVDTERFRPAAADRRTLRGKLGLSAGHRWIGCIGRIDPMKGHRVLLEAAALLRARRDDVRFLVLGAGPEADLAALKARAAALDIAPAIRWMAPRTDIDTVLPALDIVTSTSLYGEGLSNVIAEAMACGLDCVVTDSGDSALLVGATGRVVPPGDPQALARAWAALLDGAAASPARINEAARQRIVESFSIDAMVANTARVLAPA